MAQHGGARPGAGRQPGSRGNNTKLNEQLREAFIREYDKRKTGIWKALFDKAEAGDVQAIKEANDRGMGKVTENIDLTSKGEAIGYVILPPKNESPLDTTTQTGDSTRQD